MMQRKTWMGLGLASVGCLLFAVVVNIVKEANAGDFMTAKRGSDAVTPLKHPRPTAEPTLAGADAAGVLRDSAGDSNVALLRDFDSEMLDEIPSIYRSPYAGRRNPVVLATPRAAPENDDCADAYEFDLIPGSPVTVQGDNTGATKDCSLLSGSNGEVWFKFTTYEPTAEISIRYCGTDPVFTSAYRALYTSCPCAGQPLNSDIAESLSCGDGNISLAWRRTMPAGTYYWPLLTDSTQGTVEGPYTVTFSAIGMMPSLPCPAESFFGQTPKRGANTSGDAPGTKYTVWDNFSGLTQKIGSVEWWGIRLQSGASAWASCLSETPLEFEIKLYLDNDGEPGAEVASYTVTPTETYAAPYCYIGDTLHFSSGPLSPCYLLENGWISISSLPHPDNCVFLWMSSPDGDGFAYQGNPGALTPLEEDLSFCFLPGECSAVFGACCNEYTGVCVQAEAADCLPPLRFSAGTQCGDLDPPCGILGACCGGALNCVGTVFEADCDAIDGAFWPGESCEEPAFICPAGCPHRIELRSCLDGWQDNTLDVLVNGEVVLSGLTLTSGDGPVSHVFWAETGDTIETVYHVVNPYPAMQYYEVFDGQGYWLAADGISADGDCLIAPKGISILGNCEEKTTGACCHYEGGCDIGTPEECIDGEFLGVGTPCLWCPSCYILCPPDGIPEAEVCGTDTNGGCESASHAFEPIACGDTICGSLWADFPHDWDTDSFEVAPSDEFRLITWNVESLENPQVVVMRAGPGAGCDGAEIIEDIILPECMQRTTSFEMGPDDTCWYQIGRIADQVDCDVPYTLALTCEVLESGACCMPSGECIQATVSGCDAVFGSYQGDDTACADVTCTPFYCVAGSPNCSDEHIARVLVGTIDNASGCGSDGYEDYTSLSTDLLIGTPQSMSVENGNPWVSACKVWVDYNQDMDFGDEGEEVLATFSNGAYRLEITPPAGALLGTTRMRIRVGRYYGEGSGECGEGISGEVEDYTVNITDGPGACCTPDGECLTLSSAVECLAVYQGAWFSGETCVADGGSFACPVGACCVPPYECLTADRVTCDQQYGGTWYIGETCVENGGDFACPIPDFGACCMSMGACQTFAGATAESMCQAVSGSFYLGERCPDSGGDFVCPSGSGACCTQTGDCYTVSSSLDCAAQYNGTFHAGETCVEDGGDYVCPFTGGACCTSTGTCITMSNQLTCMIQYNGTYHQGEKCAADGGDYVCPFAGGACCTSAGDCYTVTSQLTCIVQYHGTYHPGEICEADGGDYVCPFTGGACCTPAGTCVTVSNQLNCIAVYSGTYYAGEKCVDDGGSFACPTVGPGWCDLDGNDVVDYDDYLLFLAAFGGPVDGDPAQDAACDFDGSGAVGLADYNAWLACYRDFIGDPFAGPPSAPGTPQPGLNTQGGLQKKNLPAAESAEAAQPAAGNAQAGGAIKKLSR